MTAPRLALVASLVCLGPTCVSASAQTDVTLEFGASQIGSAGETKKEES